MVLACLFVQTVPAGAQNASQPQSSPDLRISLNRGDRIAVELADRERLTGIVGSRLNNGFELQWPGEMRFVKYRDVRALLDPDTGDVLSYPTYLPDPVDRRWVGPVVIGLAAVGVLALLTRGIFPACLFQSCR